MMDAIVETPLIIEKPYMATSDNSGLVRGQDELIRRFLKKDGNVLYSPATIYSALCILGSLTTGESKQEVLQVLGVDEEGLIKLSNELNAAFNKEADVQAVNYYRGLNLQKKNVEKQPANPSKEKVCTMSSSLWLNGKYEYNKQRLAAIENEMGAECFIGDVNDNQFNVQLKNWLNNKTNHLLSDSVDSIKMDRNMVLSIYSALYFNAKWDRVYFKEQNTRIDRFFLDNGKAVIAEFMSTEFASAIHESERFEGISLPLSGDYNINFLLPNKGVKPRDLLVDKEALAFMAKEAEKEPSNTKVRLKIPKLDIKANLELLNTLRDLGFKKLLDNANTDFKDLCQKSVFISDGKQLNRMIVKESGVEVTSITMFNLGHTCSPVSIKRKVFVLDRPFLISITGKNTNIPMMIGVIENPLKL